MSTILGAKSIVQDNLVFHIDPSNILSVPVDKRNDPLTNEV